MQVPENVKLQKDTVLSLVKGATVFINYLGGFLVLLLSVIRSVRLRPFFSDAISQLLRTSYND